MGDSDNLFADTLMVSVIKGPVGLQLTDKHFSLFTWQGILTTLSQSNGSYAYDYATVPFLAEIFKVPCAFML